MTDADALAAIAAVDRLRLEAARAADALADLEAVMLGRGASPVAVSKLLGVPQSVRRWCGEQAQILSSFGVPVDGHGPREVRRDTIAVGVLPAMDTIEPADPLIEAIRSQSWR